jgi:hypothetical protein
MYVDVLCCLQSANKKAMEIRRGRLNGNKKSNGYRLDLNMYVFGSAS